MKGMIFAAGVGSRLRPFTDEHPKALAPVGGKPMLRRVIEKMRAAGIGRIVVNVHHFPGQIRSYLEQNDNFGAEIMISDESDTLLDTGGGLLKAARYFGGEEPILVHNADILTDFEIIAMSARHAECTPLATLLAFPRESSRQLYFDTEGNLRGWQNLKSGELKPAGFNPDLQGLTPLAFGGVHIVSPAIFPLLEEYAERNGEVFSITPFYLEIAEGAKIKAFSPASPFLWHDIGSPEKLAAAEKALITF